MSRNDPVLDRLRAADPAPDIARIDPDDISTILSLLEERRDVMTTRTPVHPPAGRPSEQERRMRPALAFSFALVIAVMAIGLGIFLFAGGSDEDVITPSETTVPAPSTTATTAPPQRLNASMPRSEATSVNRPLA